MRLIVPMALPVCKVASTRCPVSAALRASEMVFEVPQLTDADDVGIFTQRPPQAGGERLRVTADLPLIHDATLGFKDVFDGLLNGEDVVGSLFVDDVGQRRECARLAAAGGAGHQEQALCVVGQLREALRKP